METEPQINFLHNPHINANSIPDLDPVQVYVNLFNIKLTKKFTLILFIRFIKKLVKTVM